ncbi:hypothetical protein AMECASPLE_033413 [Ameca splendens]|uniref:Uncharacterized protein n=1 Tax=Ameca splendens TaxID=208324 RepID=A0ABV1A303_9TELE
MTPPSLDSPVIEPCSPSTVFTFQAHHAVLSSSFSWIKPFSREAVQASRIKFTFLWLITNSKIPLIPPWQFIISSPLKTRSVFLDLDP